MRTRTIGSYYCGCAAGFTGVPCSDVDECNRAIDNCDKNAGACHNVIGSFVCECIQGYVGDGRDCQDIDECGDSDINNCDRDSICHNTIGSYECDCNFGFRARVDLGFEPNGCLDVHECFERSHNCHSNAACHNQEK